MGAVRVWLFRFAGRAVQPVPRAARLRHGVYRVVGWLRPAYLGPGGAPSGQCRSPRTPTGWLAPCACVDGCGLWPRPACRSAAASALGTVAVRLLGDVLDGRCP